MIIEQVKHNCYVVAGTKVVHYISEFSIGKRDGLIKASPVNKAKQTFLLSSFQRIFYL